MLAILTAVSKPRGLADGEISQGLVRPDWGDDNLSVSGGCVEGQMQVQFIPLITSGPLHSFMHVDAPVKDKVLEENHKPYWCSDTQHR